MNFTENQQACIVLENLWSQREAGRFCDIVLHVQGEKFQAHRNVLASCSPFFDSVLKTHKVIKEQLTVTCQNLDAFQLLLNFMYTGSVVIDKNNVTELLQLANHFLVKKLKNYCAEFLIRYLDCSNCLTALELADKYDLQNLQKSASAFVQNHIIDILEGAEILQLNAAKLEKFLTGKVSLIPQPILLTFLCKWTAHNLSDRESSFKALLTLVNWDPIERSFLEEHVQNSELFWKSSKCMFIFLTCLEENQIELPELKKLYKALKSQYDDTANDGVSNNTATENLAKNACNILDGSAPITVAPLEKEPAKIPLPVSSKSPADEMSNSSEDVGGAEMDYDSTSSDEPSAQAPEPYSNLEKTASKKTKPSPRKRLARSRKSATSTEMEKAAKSSGCANEKTAKPVSKSKEVRAQKTRSSQNKQEKKIVEAAKKQYVSETSDDEDEEDDNGEDSSATDSSMEDSMNGQSERRKSKWKDGVKCSDCSYIAHSSSRLEQHVSKIHAKNVIYQCKICQFTCQWNRQFYLHMKEHFEGPPYRCTECVYTCERIQFLLSHRMRHTDEKPFKCDECDHRCRTKANLECHQRTHTGEKPYQCEFCERRFAIKTSLDQHLASHREDRPFLCDTCGFSTKYQSHLFSHKRIHTGDVFRCHFPNCSYSTPKKSQLGSHHRTHTAIRSHICAICGRAFIEKSHLIRHERIHLNDKPFKCEQCDYSSSRRDKLKEHFNKHHGDNATAKTPYRPRKPRRQRIDGTAVYSPSTKPEPSEADSQLQAQHMELTAASSMDTSNASPAQVVYNYDPSYPESYGHAAAALQQLGVAAAAHNYQVAFMEQRHHTHQPHHQHAAHTYPHVGQMPPSAVPGMMPEQNRGYVVSHDVTNATGQPTEFSPYLNFM